MNTILTDIAFALTDHESRHFGAEHFLDLSDGNVAFIQPEYMLDEDDISEEEIGKYKDWEQEQIRAYRDHDLVRIDPIDSTESFSIMDDFAQTRPVSESQLLCCALSRMHPFSEFRKVVEKMGLLQDWYNFKNEAERNLAQKWLEEHDLAIREDKIVRIK